MLQPLVEARVQFGGHAAGPTGSDHGAGRRRRAGGAARLCGVDGIGERGGWMKGIGHLGSIGGQMH